MRLTRPSGPKTLVASTLPLSSTSLTGVVAVVDEVARAAAVIVIAPGAQAVAGVAGGHDAVEVGQVAVGIVLAGVGVAGEAGEVGGRIAQRVVAVGEELAERGSRSSTGYRG